MPSSLTVRMGGHGSLARPTAAAATASAILAGPNPKPSAGVGTGTGTAYIGGSSSGFDAGYTYTDYSVPGGTTTLAGLSSWVAANVPDGASSTAHSRVLLGAGRTYSGTGFVDLTGRSHITFEGGGTEVAKGHTGGARLTTTGSPDPLNLVKASVWRAKSGTNSVSATDIRFHCMTVDGSYTNYRTTSAGANENEHGFSMEGVNGLQVSHVIIEKLQGDGLYLSDSTVGASSSAYYTRSVTIQDSTIRYVGRMGVALINTQDVTIDTCTFTDICYCPFDIEPNKTWQAIRGTTRFVNSLIDGDYWSWGSGFQDAAWSLGAPLASSISGSLTISGNTVTAAMYPGDVQDVVRGGYGEMVYTATFTFTNNVSTNRRAGPIVGLSGWSAGATVTGNTGWLSSGSFVGNYGGNGTITQSGNT